MVPLLSKNNYLVAGTGDALSGAQVNYFRENSVDRRLQRLVVAHLLALTFTFPLSESATAGESSPFPPSGLHAGVPFEKRASSNAQFDGGDASIFPPPQPYKLAPQDEFRGSYPSQRTMPIAVTTRVMPGRVAVVVAGQVHQVRVATSPTSAGDAAGRSFGASARDLARGFSESRDPRVAVMAPAIIPLLPVTLLSVGTVGALIGLAKNGIEGISREDAQLVGQRIKSSLGETSVEEHLATSIAKLGAELGHYGFEVRTLAGETEAQAAPTHENLKRDGFDAVLELRVGNVAVIPSAGGNYARLLVQTDMRLLPLDGTAPSAFSVDYVGNWSRLGEWTDVRAELARSEVTNAGARLSRELVDAAFWDLSRD